MSVINDLLPLRGLEGVGLDELIELADLQVRRDRKYLVPCSFIDVLTASLGPGTRVLRVGGVQSFGYESVYFDTGDWASYLGAARRRPRRFKVRTRTYIDSGSCMLEVKVRDARGQTVKHRRPYAIGDRHHLSHDGRGFVEGILQIGARADLLTPTLTTTYRRTTLLLPGDAARVTVDIDVAWQDPSGRRTTLPGLALIETKSAGPPSEVDRALWRHGYRPTTISKYCTGLAAVSPDLPANKWNRVLRQHFNWYPRRLTVDGTDRPE